MGVKFGISTADGKGIPEPGRVEIKEQLGEVISYTIVFAEDVCDNDFLLFINPAMMPCKEFSIWVEMENEKGNNEKHWLVKGPVSSQDLKIVNGGQGSEISVKGSDNSIKMKQLEKKKNHADQKDYDIVSSILKDAKFTSPKNNIANKNLLNDSSKHSKMQNQDDLAFLKHLAGEYGMYLWISYDDQGNEIANFNELPLENSPAATLIINGTNDIVNNIDELNIQWNADVPTAVVGEQIDTKTKKAVDPKVDSPPQHKLGGQTLADLTKTCRQEVKSTPRPADDSGRAQERSKGALNEAEWFIKATCSTSFDRLCKILHAHTIVEVKGAGSRHSGNYLVSSVTHTIDRSSYKMQLELKRNAWDQPSTKNGLPGIGA